MDTTKARTNMGITLMLLDKRHTSVAAKALLAASKVGLVSWEALALSYRHRAIKEGQRCGDCGQIVTK